MERYRTGAGGITPQNISSITNSNLFGAPLGDPNTPGVDRTGQEAQNFFGGTVSGGVSTLGSWYSSCTPPDPYGNSPVSQIVWPILWGFILVAIIGALGSLFGTQAIGYVSQLINGFFKIFGDIVTGVGTVAVSATKATGQELQAVTQETGGLVGTGAQAVGTVVSGVGQGAGTAISGVARGAGQAVSGIAQGVGTGIRGIERGTGEALAGIPEAVNILAPATAAAAQNVVASVLPNAVPVGYTPIN